VAAKMIETQSIPRRIGICSYSRTRVGDGDIFLARILKHLRDQWLRQRKSGRLVSAAASFGMAWTYFPALRPSPLSLASRERVAE
jgi:hypothetical protein